MNALPSRKATTARPRFGVTHVEVRGFRSARDVAFSPGPLCVLVGEADAGKSNLLAAIRAVLDPAAAPLTAADVHEAATATSRSAYASPTAVRPRSKGARLRNDDHESRDRAARALPAGG